MPDIFQTFTFTFEGRAEFIGEPNNPQVSINTLNQKSDSIALQIERELRRSLPPQFSVQAEVSFSEGSAIMTGTVLLFSWLGSVALKTAREEFENQFREVIRVAIQRVISRVFRDHSGSLSPMQIDSVRPVFSGTTAQSTEDSTRSEPSTEGVVQPSNRFTPEIILLIVNALLTIALLIVVFERLPPTAPNQTSPPADSESPATNPESPAAPNPPPAQ